MKEYKFTIRPEFLPLIRQGIKQREYRLNSPNRQPIQAGDILYMESTEDSKDYIRVLVLAKEIFPNWEEALKDTWFKDFQGHFSSLEETIKTCKTFYKPSEIKKYGIAVFSIKPLN